MPPSPYPHRIARLLALATAAALTGASPALAQAGGWADRWDQTGNSDPWGPDRWDSHHPDTAFGEDAREGAVTVERFPVADSAPLLGHGRITVTAQAPSDHRPDDQAPNDQAPDSSPPPADTPPPGAPPIAPERGFGHPAYGPDYLSPREAAVFEASVVDQLAKAGYDTAVPSASGPASGPANTQVALLHITHTLLTPAEERHSPVSGEMAMGASNHGSMLGFGLNIDLSKPRAALISTTLALRIRDASTGRPLWEGRARIATREGSSHWSQQAIATRLAAALFEGFAPKPGAPPGR